MQQLVLLMNEGDASQKSYSKSYYCKIIYPGYSVYMNHFHFGNSLKYEHINPINKLKKNSTSSILEHMGENTIKLKKDNT